MTEAAIPEPSLDDDALETLKIHFLLRYLTGALGGAGLTFGTLAVFKTHVEAGPVALLAVGLIFAVISISGQVPWRIKFGDTQIELQRERRKRRNADAAAVDLAGSVDPKKQAAPVEAVERTLATNPSLGAAMQSALGYEAMVMVMIERIIARKNGRWVAPDELISLANAAATPTLRPIMFDGLIARNDGTTRRALVEIKASSQDIDVGFVRVLHDRFVRGVNLYGAEMLLLVTREPLTQAAERRIREWPDKRWVQVTGLADEEALDNAIEQLIGPLYWETVS